MLLTPERSKQGLISLAVTAVAAWFAVGGIGCVIAGEWVCAATVLPTSVFVLIYQYQQYR